jgi:two-component system chemotaxis sensor kinase CheA
MDDLLREFLTETSENLETVDMELVRFEQQPNNAEILNKIFRLVHTIKGTCGFLRLPRLEALTHAAEALMESFRGGKFVSADAVTLILASIDRIKELLNGLDRNGAELPGDDRDLIEQLHRMSRKPTAIEAQSTHRAARESPAAHPALSAGEPQASHEGSTATGTANHASSLASGTGASASTAAAENERAAEARGGNSIRVQVDTLEQLMTAVSELVLTRNQLLDLLRRDQDSAFKAPLQRLSHVTAELQDTVLKARMQPIGNAWQKLPRMVRDLAAELDKPIELKMNGADTELDRQVLELIKDPLLHMVRNAADHGLESPSQRLAAGKPERGLIRVSARHEGGYIVIEIADDGRGLDVPRIAAKAVALGLASESEIAKSTQQQIQRFIFAPGFSTLDNATSVSGRGVGMDVVRANIERIGGTIAVSSISARGTIFTIKIPLTLAIVPALVIQAAGERFAIPQLAVVEIMRARSHSEHRIERIKNAPVLRLRDRLLAVADLAALLKLRRETSNGFVVVMQAGSQSFGLVVDGVFDTEEIVVKPIASALRSLAMFSGNTILGDGSVILIIDPNAIAQAMGLAQTVQPMVQQQRLPEHTLQSNDAMLLFRAGSSVPKAVPVSLVTRLEEIDVRKFEIANGRTVLQYRGHLMPLIPANPELKIKTGGMQPLLVFSDHRRSLGLLVDEIIDIVEGELDITLASERPGLLGSAVIKGQATEVIDIAHFLPLAFDDWSEWKQRVAQMPARRVLLVDDAPFFRNMLAPVLKAAGYSVTAVASGQEAIALLQTGQSFDIIITDMDMAGTNGFELTSALRSHSRTADLPVIGLSSVISPEAAERGKRIGLNQCLAKFDRRGLIAALKERTAELQCA